MIIHRNLHDKPCIYHVIIIKYNDVICNTNLKHVDTDSQGCCLNVHGLCFTSRIISYLKSGANENFLSRSVVETQIFVQSAVLTHQQLIDASAAYGSAHRLPLS